MDEPTTSTQQQAASALDQLYSLRTNIFDSLAQNVQKDEDTNPERAFEAYLGVIRESHDLDMIKRAYAVAAKIEDAAAKSDALSTLASEVNYTINLIEDAADASAARAEMSSHATDNATPPVATTSSSDALAEQAKADKKS